MVDEHASERGITLMNEALREARMLSLRAEQE